MPGPVCRAVRMASAGRRACLYRLALPLPLGAGDYVRPAVIGSACCEGAGGIVEVLLSIGSSSSFPACFAVSLCRSHPRPPRLMCFIHAPCVRSCLAPCILVWFLIVSLPVLAISRAGRSVFACLFVEALVLFALLVPYRPLVRLFSPSLNKRWRGVRRLVLACLPSSPVVRAAAGVGGLVSAGMVCCLAGLRVGVLCLVCGVGVCIYKLGACSCMMIDVERKRLRRDFRR